jgi:hypothetical protein
MFPPVRTMDIPAKTETIVFDGIDNESSWSSPQSLSIFNQMGWDGTDEDFIGYFKVCRDMHYTYLFADITDDIDESCSGSCQDSWYFDCIEFCMNLDTSDNTNEYYDDNSMQLRINRGIDSVTWDLDNGKENYAWDSTYAPGIIRLVVIATFIDIPGFHDPVIKVYPNPAARVIYVVGASAFRQINILALRGQVVKQVQANGSQIPIEVADLRSGIYFLRGIMQDGSVQIVPLAIQ